MSSFYYFPLQEFSKALLCFAAPSKSKKSSKAGFLPARARSLFPILALIALLCLPQCSGARVGSGGGENPDDGPAPNSACASAAEASGFNGGDGTSASSPFLICAYAQLALMDDSAAALSAYYKLGDNISATGTWTPLGDETNSFDGSLEGDGYAISNLMVNISGTGDQYGGLFAYLGSAAKISNVGLTAIDITVVSTNMSGEAYAGGLVGYNNSGSITNSYAQGTVSAASDNTSAGSGESYAGGLVGWNNSGSITNSYAAASASAVGKSSRSGGLAGFNSGSITNSYAAGSASAGGELSSRGGGLLGWNNSRGIITNSYAVGSPVGCVGMVICNGDEFGRLIGFSNNAAGVTDSFWGSTTGLGNGCGSGTCPADGSLTFMEMQATSGTYPDMLGGAFKLTDGAYPKLFLCTVCTGTLVYSTELLPGQ